MDKVRLATDERVDLVDALRLGTLTEDALMRLVQVFFGQTDSGYTTLTDEAALFMPTIWEPIALTHGALDIDLSVGTTAASRTITLELRKAGSRRARIWGGDGNQLSGDNATATLAYVVPEALASGVYYIKVRRKETENRGFPATSESRMYINRTTQQEFGQATNTKLLDEWEVDPAATPPTSAAPSGRLFSVAAFEVKTVGGLQKIVVITNLAGYTTTTGSSGFTTAPASFAWKRAKTHAWSSRTTAAQDSFRTLKDVYDALTTAISEMRDGQLWLVDPATQAKFNSGGGVKLSNGAVIGITGTGVQIADGGAGTPVTLQVYDGQVIFAKGGATYFVGDALTAGRTLWASQDTTRTLRIRSDRADGESNVGTELLWKPGVTGTNVPKPGSRSHEFGYLDSASTKVVRGFVDANIGVPDSYACVFYDDFVDYDSLPDTGVEALLPVFRSPAALANGATAETDLTLLGEITGAPKSIPLGGIDDTNVVGYEVALVDVSDFRTLVSVTAGNLTIRAYRGATAVTPLLKAFTSGTALKHTIPNRTSEAEFTGQVLSFTYEKDAAFTISASGRLMLSTHAIEARTRARWQSTAAFAYANRPAFTLASSFGGSSKQLGVLRCETGSTLGDVFSIQLRNGRATTTSSLPFRGSSSNRIVARFRIALANLTSTKITFGIAASTSTQNAKFVYDTAVTARWQTVVDNGTATDFSPLFAPTSAFYTFEIHLTPASTTFVAIADDGTTYRSDGRPVPTLTGSDDWSIFFAGTSKGGSIADFFVDSVKVLVSRP